MPGLGSLVGGIRPVSAVRRGEMYIVELGENDRPLPNESRGPVSRKFQYFPGSITDSKAVNYATKEIPGGSLPIYQWINSGERALSFQVSIATDVDHLQLSGGTLFGAVGGAVGQVAGDQAPDEEELRTWDRAVEAANSRLQGVGQRERNVFVPGAVLWLRRFMFPRYEEEAGDVGVPLTKPPRKLLLFMPNSGLDMQGGEGGFSSPGGGIFCHMTQCDVTWEKFFPSGNPRLATVALAFAEDAQRGGRVRFPAASVSVETEGDSGGVGTPGGSAANADQRAAQWYSLTPEGSSGSNGVGGP